MRRNGLFSLIFIVVLAAAGLAGTLVADNEPLLGLDLQGGVSVVLEPVEETEEGALTQAIEIIRQRVDGLGVAEPDINRQGDAIVVQLPGVDNRDRALELVGQTAELRFRPVIAAFPPSVAEGGNIPADGQTPEQPSSQEPGSSTTTSPPGGEGSAPAPTAGDEDASDEDAGDEVGYGLAPGESASPPLQVGEGETTTTTAPDPTTTTAPSGQDTPIIPDLENLELTPPEEAAADEPVTLGQFDDGIEQVRYQLGPTAATGEILTDAMAELEGVGTWRVGVELDDDGLAQFNQIAAECFNRTPTCPSGRLGIVLDSQVESAPTINDAAYGAGGVSITGDFSESEAKDLALVLRYGSLPVELEPQQTQSVSASLGRDALDAGVVAGLIGLGLVALYMLVYYRLLGLVAILSLALSGVLLWVIIAYLGESQGLALTLAGVTGLILAIGVAVDSNIVFYEHLKEQVSRGRTLRSAIDGSFASAFSTIVKADVASLIGAGILYWLTVGPVRGFALYLGLGTLLDLVASYFFMRPLALILVKSRGLQAKPRVFGMPVAQEEAVA